MAKNEIYSQLRTLKPDVSFTDAKLFLYMVEGTIIQLLSSGGVSEREGVFECFTRANYMQMKSLGFCQ